MTGIFYELLKMSLQGTVIILIVGLVRLLLKRLHVEHTYIVWLWLIVFFYLVFPWKLSVPAGFWNTENMFEENRGAIADYEDTYEVSVHSNISIVNNTEDTATPVGMQDPSFVQNTVMEVQSQANSQSEPENIKIENPVNTTRRTAFDLKIILPYIWMFVLLGFFGYFVYSYFAIKKKLLLSIPYEENIWWTENINTPMVFGLVTPKVYLPVSVEQESLNYIIAHEEMHIQRKDAFLKMIAHIICMIHWFNPLVWVAYFLLGSDIEKACDEEVIRHMGEESRKEYAYALLRIASGDHGKKVRIFVAPTCFAEGNVKERIRNVVKYKRTLPGIGLIVAVIGFALGGLFMTQTEEKDMESGTENEIMGSRLESGENNNSVDEEEDGELQIEYPAFYVEDLDVLQIDDASALEDYYITSRFTASNHFYIDESGTLWGTGTNEYGQLGTGIWLEEYHEEPVKIAEHVVSVDASWNNYFCIYLTESGELYGVGSNYAGLLLGKGSEKSGLANSDYQKVISPVLLMSDVAYARAGLECIVALQTDKTAYWWGQYAPLTHTDAGGSLDDYWKVEEDAANPVKMFAGEPMKIMENCQYITTGTFTGAAISEDGELYTWGLNAFGQCGVEVTKDDFVRTPVKVMDDVKMVWVDKIEFNDPKNRPSDIIRRDMDYVYNTFVLTRDNSLLAAGHNLGNKEKLTEINEDIAETQLHLYTDTFIPVQAVEYSESANREKLNQLFFGMTLEEVEVVLERSGLSSFRTETDGNIALCIEDSRYFCHFDEMGVFYSLLIQEGGSRDNRFQIGMSLSELKEAVENSGGTLSKNEAADIYTYSDEENSINYEFFIYEDKISVLREETMEKN